MKKLLGVAQPFGFGGITELLALEGALSLESGDVPSMECLDHPQFRVVIESTRKGLSLKEHKPTEAVGMEALFEQVKESLYDGVISSYDTSAIFYGWFKGIKTMLYDGMFWFWEFEKYRERASKILEEMQTAKAAQDQKRFSDICNQLFNEDYHLTMLIAYHLADRISIRGAPQIPEKMKDFPEFSEKVKVVGAVIDPTQTSEKSERSHILVSLSGSLAPTVSFEQNLIYARGAFNAVKEARTLWNDTETTWIFSCHPRLFEQLDKEVNKGGGIELQPSFSYQKNLRMIRTAQGLFVSPGFSSVQEAAYFETPVFLLPEQNGGQPTGFHTLREAGYPTTHSWTATQELHGGNVTRGEEDVAALYEDVAQLWGDVYGAERRARIHRFLSTLQDESARTELVHRQHEAVKKMIGGFNGARESIKFFLEVLDR